MQPHSCFSSQPLNSMNHVSSHFMAFTHAVSLCSSPHCFCFRPCTLPSNLLLILQVSVKRTFLQGTFSWYTSQAWTAPPFIYSWHHDPHLPCPTTPLGLQTLPLLAWEGSACSHPTLLQLPLKQVLSDAFNSPGYGFLSLALCLSLFRATLGFCLDLFGTNAKLWALSHQFVLSSLTESPGHTSDLVNFSLWWKKTKNMFDEPVDMESLKFLLTQNTPGHGCSCQMSYHTVSSDTCKKRLVFFLFDIFSQTFLSDMMLGLSANYFCGQKEGMTWWEEIRREIKRRTNTM